jgi:hypothetical protein
MLKIQPDLDKKLISTTDASEVGVGAVLSQEVDGKEKLISAAFSKKMDTHQIHYAVTDKKLLALVQAC